MSEAVSIAVILGFYQRSKGGEDSDVRDAAETLFKTSSIWQSHPCFPLPTHHPQQLAAVPNNMSP